MRYLLPLLLLSLFCTESLFAQPANIVWQRTAGSLEFEQLDDLIITSDGYVVLSGLTYGVASGDRSENVEGDEDSWIVKIDPANGNIIWENTIQDLVGGPIDAYLAPAALGKSVVFCASDAPAGLDKTEASVLRDYWVLELLADGSIGLQDVFTGLSSESASQIIPTSDGGFLICGGGGIAGGDKDEGSQGLLDMWVIKLASDLSMQWQESVGSPSIDISMKAAQVANGYVLVCESGTGVGGDKTDAGYGSTDIWVVKLDQAGNVQSNFCLGGAGAEATPHIISTADGGVVIAIRSESDISGNKTVAGFGGIDTWLVKLGSNGQIQWQRQFGTNATDYPGDVYQRANGNLLLAMYTSANSGSTGNLDPYATPLAGSAWLVELTIQGDIVWQDVYSGNALEYPFGIAEDANGNIYLGIQSSSPPSGNKTSPQIGSFDYWVLKLDTSCQETYYADSDNDGYGDPNDSIVACTAPAGYVLNSDDCDDSNPALYLGASCEDGDPCTDGEVLNASCGCVGGTPIPDSDSDGLCDAIDDDLGDTCFNAISLTVETTCNFQEFSTVGLTSSVLAMNPNCGFYQGRDIWFSFEVPASGYFRTEVIGIGGFNAQFALYDDCGPTGFVIRCDQLTNDENFYLPDLIGSTVFLRVWNYNSTNPGDFELCVWEPVAPVNDLCENAIPLTVDSSCNLQSFTNAYATTEAGLAPSPGCGFFQDGDVWFTFDAPASGNFRIEIEGISSNPQFALYTGTCGDFTLISCDQLTDSENYSDPSLAGQTLHIRVWNYNNEDGGEFELCIWEMPVPVNNHCADAIGLTVGNSCNLQSYTALYGTTEEGLAPSPGCGFFVDADVWFTFEVPASGDFRVEIQSAANISYALYSGTCGDFTVEACESLTGDFENFSRPDLAGQTIYLRVWRYNNEDGAAFDLCIWEPNVPANDLCANAVALPVGTSCVPQSFTTEFGTGDTEAGVSSSCGFFQGGDVWFTAVMPASGHLRVEVEPTSGETQAFSIYTGTCGALTEIECAQATEFINLHDETLAGQTLYIRVFRYNSEGGMPFSICVWEPAIPDNDFCDMALELPVGAECQPTYFNNFGCTPDEGISSPGFCTGFNGYSSMWFTAVVPADGELIIDLFPGTLANPNMGLYTGDCTELAPYACVNSGSSNGSQVGRISIADPLLGGQTLYVMVYGWTERDGGDFGICAFTNCDGVGTTYYSDMDGDGFGDPNSAFIACYPQTGFVLNADDCDDQDPAIYQGATCDDGNPLTVNDSYNSSCQCLGLLPGCVDPLACNFDPSAGVDDGSCEFLSCSDDDMDGLTYEEETTIGTDPNDPDTDDDGVQDGEEVNTYGSDPLIQDTDGDGLTDGLEVNTSLTDPTLPDTNGNGCEDAIEYAGACPGSCATDLNNDGVVNTGDLVLLLSSFGQVCN